MKRLGIIFGGRSHEHEISVLSAASIIGAIDRSKYEIVPIAINKSGDWFHITTDMSGLESLEDERFGDLIPASVNAANTARHINVAEFADMVDFAFPALHGPYGEDGTIQGLFEMLGLPYAGCGVTAAALSMDKIYTKEILIRNGLPVCKHMAVFGYEFAKDSNSIMDLIEAKLGYPVFVKPSNMGSSVGVSKVSTRESLFTAINTALRYDSRVIVEESIDGRELEIALLGNHDAKAGAIGEIIQSTDFYDYDTKYKSADVELSIPAKLPHGITENIETLAEDAYKALGGAGFSRIDFFFCEKTGKIYINEMNAIPGFTKYSMFPLLWAAKGVAYGDLIERIIALGYERYNAKNNR